MEVNGSPTAFQELVEKYRCPDMKNSAESRFFASPMKLPPERRSPRKAVTISYSEGSSSSYELDEGYGSNSTRSLKRTKRGLKQAVKMDGQEETKSSSPSSPKKKKKKKPSRPYADPNVYSHLPLMDHWLKEGLNLIMIGINPGVMSAQLNQHYANPTNHFYKCLHGAGFTERRLLPSEGVLLPELYGIGSTNLNPRPTAEASELSKEEMRACVPSLLRRLLHYSPKIACFVGMEICAYVWWYLNHLPPFSLSTSEIAEESKPKVNIARETQKEKSTNLVGRSKKSIGKVTNGLQPFAISFASTTSAGDRDLLYFYAVPSTSARVVYYQLDDKIRIWKDLKVQVERLNENPPNLLELPTGSNIYPAECLIAYMDEQDTLNTSKIETEDLFSHAKTKYMDEKVGHVKLEF